MERDIGRIKKNKNTDIVVRIDDFGGKVSLTIREYMDSDRYTGFTKSGTRIPAESFKNFKEMINSIDEKDFEVEGEKSKEEEKEETEDSESEERPEKSGDEAEEQEEIEETLL